MRSFSKRERSIGRLKLATMAPVVFLLRVARNQSCVYQDTVQRVLDWVYTIRVVV